MMFAIGIGATAFSPASVLSQSRVQNPVQVRMAVASDVKPVVVGIAADSGCGKSTFMRRMTSLFGGKASPPEGGNPDSNTLISDTTTVLCLDDYHLNDREGRKKSGLTALNLAEQDFGTSPTHSRTRAINDARLARAGCGRTTARAPRTGPEGRTRELRYFFRDAQRTTLLRPSFSH